MKNKLFESFNPLSSKQWKAQINYELKGADYAQNLIWESPEGINVRPFYHADEAATPLAVTTHAIDFKIVQNIFVYDLKASIVRALKTLQRGAESLHFTIPLENKQKKSFSEADLETLLSALPLSTTCVYLSFKFLDIALIQKADFLAKKYQASLYLQIDPIGQLARQGNWYTDLKTDLHILNQAATTCSNNSFLSIDGSLYQNAGAHAVQQIAYCLAHVNEYFNRITTISKTITIQMAVGSNYFFEIAKLRAMRLLFQLIAKEYNHSLDCHLLVTPSKRNKTIYDYNVNMLRTTTECMSAILGGANAVAHMAYDALYHKENEFGDRISRNQLLILKHESYFNTVNNPADGTYYIETLTEQLAEKALSLFKNIEAHGGFITQLIQGTIQQKINQSAKKEQELFHAGKELLIGTNTYQNPKDTMKETLELFPFVKVNPRKTLIIPIIEKRLAETLEQERLQKE